MQPAAILLPFIISSGAPTQRTIFSELEQEIEHFLDKRGIPGTAFGIMDGPRLIYAKSNGFGNILKKKKFELDTPCSIGSVSKAITSAAVLALVSETNLSLDESVQPILLSSKKYLDTDFGDSRFSRVTVRHLLQQTSGLSPEAFKWPNRWNYVRQNITKGDLSSVIKMSLSWKMDSSPGERFAYNNLNYLILNDLIQIKSKISYEAFVQSRILAPLGIRSAALVKSRLEEVEGSVALNHDLGQKSIPSIHNLWKEELVPVSYGGIDYPVMGIWQFSILDLARFARSIIWGTHPKIRQAFFAQIRSTPKTVNDRSSELSAGTTWYGLGWFCFKSPNNGLVTIEHLGKTSGSIAGVSFRDDGKTVLFVSNGSDENSPWAVEQLTILHQSLNSILQRTNGRLPVADLLSN